MNTQDDQHVEENKERRRYQAPDTLDSTDIGNWNDDKTGGVRLKKGPETEREETKQNQFEESQEFMSEDSRLTMRKDIFVSYVDIDDFFYKVFYLQKKFSLCKTVMLLVSSEDGVGNIKNLALTVLSQNPIL